MYCSCNIIWVSKSRGMSWAGYVVHVWKKRNVCRVLVGKPEEERPLGRPHRMWEDNIKIDFKEIGWWAWIG